MYPLIEVCVLQAIAHSKTGNEQKRDEWMRKGIELAAQDAILNPFLRAGKNSQDILLKIVQAPQAKDGNSREDEFAAQALGLFEPGGSVDRSMPDGRKTKRMLLKHILTDREIAIFDKLLGGLSEKDIAQQSMISINTVKAHVRNIYKKLDIHNRREAHRWMNEDEGTV